MENPVFRTQEQVAYMEQRGNAHTNLERREQENERNAEAMARNCENHLYSEQENNRNAEAMMATGGKKFGS
jgi:hypothetical protein